MHSFPLRNPCSLTFGPHFPLGKGLHTLLLALTFTLLQALVMSAQPEHDLG